MLRLLLCDYQRTARYYTIYRTFKSWLSDDFTTIPRLFYWRNYDYWLRLLLTSISYRAKARKELRRQPPMVPRHKLRPRCWTAPPGASLASDPQTVGADPAGLAWSAICCTGWHGSIIGTYPYIYLIIIGGCAELYSVRA